MGDRGREVTAEKHMFNVLRSRPEMTVSMSSQSILRAKRKMWSPSVLSRRKKIA